MFVSLDPEFSIARINLAMPGKVNKINETFVAEFGRLVEAALSDPELKGITIESSLPDFCVGADLDRMSDLSDTNSIMAMVDPLCLLLRKLETCGKPVVALLNGATIGGGFEIALACHHRIAVNQPRIKFALPEVSFGIMPAVGGTQRLLRVAGVQVATEAILQAKTFNVSLAKEAGLIDDVVDSGEELYPKAKAWIAQNPKAKQAWDLNPADRPRPLLSGEEMRDFFLAASAMLEKKTAGAALAPKLALSAISEGSRLGFDGGMQVERRYFLSVLKGPQAKNMLRTFWTHKNSAEKQEGLPQTADSRFKTIGLLGAGMMGAGLAVVCAKAGFRVILKDIAQGNLDAAIKRCRSQLKDDVFTRITPTLDNAPLSECDLIIEAVFESLALKHQVLREIEPFLSKDAVWASNTSALPISEIAEASQRPQNVIGLHYFSPPERMQLVEIIKGQKTSEETLARCLRFSKQTRKIPIVVNDAYAFYATRVFCAYVLEGAELVAEGHDPILVDWAAKTAGMAVGPLQVLDEVTLGLIVHAMKESERYWGKRDTPGMHLLQKLVDMGRNGKAAQQGFYDYKGKRVSWPGLKSLVGVQPKEVPLTYLQDRLMFSQCVQAANTIDLGIIDQVRDAEIGAVLGLGFAPQTGGPLAYMNDIGIPRVISQLESFTKTCGARYQPAKVLYALAEKQKGFY